MEEKRREERSKWKINIGSNVVPNRLLEEGIHWLWVKTTTPRGFKGAAALSFWGALFLEKLFRENFLLIIRVYEEVSISAYYIYFL